MEAEDRSRFPPLLFTPSQVITICISFVFFAIGTYGLLIQNTKEIIPKTYVSYQTSYVIVSQAGFQDISQTISELVDTILADQMAHNPFLLEADYRFWHQISELNIDDEQTWAFDTFLEYDNEFHTASYYCVLENPYTLRCTPLILS